MGFRDDHPTGIRRDFSTHGFVRLVDVMGNDAAIVQAARVSYGDGTKSFREDRALIRHLMRLGHTSPFEMIELKFHIKDTLFDARQIVRHRTASWNEISARYSTLKDEYWVPDAGEVREAGGSNKQGSLNVVNPDGAEVVRLMQEVYNFAHETYEKLMEDHSVPREQARAILPVGIHTEWYWKIDGNNLMKFLALRLDSHAQPEVRKPAQLIYELFAEQFPITAGVFESVMLKGGRLTYEQLKAIAQVLDIQVFEAREKVRSTAKAFRLSDHEADDLLKALWQ